MGQPRLRLKWMLLGVLVAALLTRVATTTLVLHTQASEDRRAIEIHPDTREYVRLGEQMYQHGMYGSKKLLRHRVTGLVRPPAIPAWLWAGRSIGLDAVGLIWSHAILGAVMPVGAFFLARQVSGSDRVAFAVGMLSAFSPTGIASASVFLADVWFAVFFTAGLVLWIRASQTGRVRLVAMLLAGGMFALAHLAKPALMWFPVVIIVCALLRRRHVWAFIPLLVPMLVVTALWSARNHRAENVFAYSTITARNLTYFVVPWVELAEQKDRFPTRAEFRMLYRQKVAEHEQFIRDHPQISAGEVYLEQSRAARGSLVASPEWTLMTLGNNAFNQVTMSWASADRQFPGESFAARWLRWFFSVLSQPIWGVVWIGLTAAGAMRWLWLRPDDRWAVVLLSLTWWYFAAICSTTHGEGSRLMYPVEAVALTLMAGLFVRPQWLRRRMLPLTRPTARRSAIAHTV